MTINRPRHCNAINFQMWRELAEIDRDRSALAVVIAGASGEAFSVGAGSTVKKVGAPGMAGSVVALASLETTPAPRGLVTDTRWCRSVPAPESMASV